MSPIMSPVARAAAVALLVSVAFAPAAAQTPARTYTVELDAEKDYFAPGTVRIVAMSRAAGPVEVGALDVTVRRRIAVSVPVDARELVFNLGSAGSKDIVARLKLSSGSGTIVVRPLSNAGSASGLAWMLGRRGGIKVERLMVQFKGD